MHTAETARRSEKGYQRLLFYLFYIAFCANNLQLQAQKNEYTRDSFIIDRQLSSTTVKDQGRSGTCWSFAAVSFIESELMRTGKGVHDLSEMFLVRSTYLAKADKYIRMHGTINFGSGGEANDVTDAISRTGVVPESVFPGKGFDVEKFDFESMDRELKDYVDEIIRSPEGTIDPLWKEGFLKILDRYLGKVPDSFDWKGRRFTASTFADSLGVKKDDYILIGSYTHHPFYEKFILEVPDNWSWEMTYNVPLNEMMGILEHSLMNGYTVVWAADITEEGFSFQKGLAVLQGEERTGARGRPPQDMQGVLLPADSIDSTASVSDAEKYCITQEMRQNAFDQFETQDDHAMHIIGTAHNGEGNRFYYIKNSWGTDNVMDGYIFVSEQYIRYKTISFMVNRNALAPELMKKLNIN